MTARGIADRLVAKYGVRAARCICVERMRRHHALTQDAMGRGHFALRASSLRFLLWSNVSLAITRTANAQR